MQASQYKKASLSEDPVYEQANKERSGHKVYRVYDDLPEKKQLIVDFIVNDQMDHEQAYLKAGYSSNSGWKAAARKIYLQIRQVVHQECIQRLDKGVPVAIQVLNDIMVDKSMSPSVRLKAATTVLDRTGFHEKQEVITTDKSVHELNQQELNAELEQALQELGPQALTVVKE